MYTYDIAFLVFLVASFVEGGNVRVDPLLQTRLGLIRGQNGANGGYAMFLGIPYAQVDVNNPFGASLPHAGFTEVYNAYNGNIACPQMQKDNSKTVDKSVLDCLIVNIYVPEDASPENLLPVKVWIHGGAFIEGKAGDYDPSPLVKHGIVVVTMNYRLGPYGFFCLNVPSVTGNQGLKDQYTGFQWIRDYISDYGGDPSKVTIAGHNAGAASVDIHLYSSQDKLFIRAIMQSGVAQSDGMFVQSDLEAAIKLANHLGFNITDTYSALEALAVVSPDIVVEASTKLGLNLGPCKEKSYSGVQNIITTDPFTMRNQKRITNTSILIGATTKESNREINAFLDIASESDLFYNYLAKNFNFDEAFFEKMSMLIRRFYIGDKNISIQVNSEIEQFRSDVEFYHAVEREVSLFVDQNVASVYKYMFDDSNITNSVSKEGAYGAELKYLFESSAKNHFNEEESLLKDRITSMWANFVISGDPTPETNDLIPVNWEPVKDNLRPYLVIGSELRMESRLYHDRMAFWDIFMLNYQKRNKLIKACTIGYPFYK